jgi:hypothetical protein
LGGWLRSVLTLTVVDVLLTNTLHVRDVSGLCFFVQQFSGTEILPEIWEEGERRTHVDAMLCRVPPGACEIQIVQPHSLPMRLGVVTAVARIIEYYIRESFRQKAAWIPPDQRGKIIQFPAPQKKSA